MSQGRGLPTAASSPPTAEAPELKKGGLQPRAPRRRNAAAPLPSCARALPRGSPLAQSYGSHLFYVFVINSRSYRDGQVWPSGRTAPIPWVAHPAQGVDPGLHCSHRSVGPKGAATSCSPT